MTKRKLELRQEERSREHFFRPPRKTRKTSRDSSVVAKFNVAPLRDLKLKKVENHDDYLENFRLFKSALIEELSDSPHSHVIYVEGLFNDCQTYSALYQHLRTIKLKLGREDELLNGLLSCWPMTLGLAYEKSRMGIGT